MRTLFTLLAASMSFTALAAARFGTPAPRPQTSTAAPARADSLGWANEKMPPGMRKGEQPNEYIWEKDGSVMLYVAAGDFSMGRDWTIAHEMPVHTVRLGAYYIDKYEVRRGAFKRFADAAGYKTTAEQKGVGKVVGPQGLGEVKGKSWRDPGFEQDDNHPVVLVSWDDAKAYAAWVGKSLPTEAEWEKAATWDESAPADKKKRLHPWGNNAAAGRDSGLAIPILVGNFADVNYGALMPAGVQKDYIMAPHFAGQYDDGYVYTAPVGKFLRGKSPYGVLDMEGNVWEWCEDGYDPNFYSRPAVPNPVNNDGSKGRVARGCAYDEPATTPWPSTFRVFFPAGESFSSVGFRCVVRAP
ncbi:MAG: SUMF1/EgtB/PvdO family nonheme iron enzyme [Pyrinomonadaceae bacterium]